MSKKLAIAIGVVIVSITISAIAVMNVINLSENNDLDLTFQNGFSVTLGAFNGRSIVETNETISINTGVIELDPVIHYEVKIVNNIKVGYLVFVDFLSGENDKWLKISAISLSAFWYLG